MKAFQKSSCLRPGALRLLVARLSGNDFVYSPLQSTAVLLELPTLALTDRRGLPPVLPPAVPSLGRDTDLSPTDLVAAVDTVHLRPKVAGH